MRDYSIGESSNDDELAITSCHLSYVKEIKRNGISSKEKVGFQKIKRGVLES